MVLAPLAPRAVIGFGLRAGCGKRGARLIQCRRARFEIAGYFCPAAQVPGMVPKAANWCPRKVKAENPSAPRSGSEGRTRSTLERRTHYSSHVNQVAGHVSCGWRPDPAPPDLGQTCTCDSVRFLFNFAPP